MQGVEASSLAIVEDAQLKVDIRFGWCFGAGVSSSSFEVAGRGALTT